MQDYKIHHITFLNGGNLTLPIVGEYNNLTIDKTAVTNKFYLQKLS